ncbi:MAG: 50S ribosomal protein L13 [Chloroflexi bacterium RBG_13_53_26]|nr:MAG: 50S ribosomal protein L13 [Chloroflexi bacterium RBG_13_53_26]
MMTYSMKGSDIEHRWHVMDASGKTLGRLATEVARLLQGKNKPMYSRHLDNGDFVIVINAAKVCVTGKKSEQKIYYRHTQYPGGLRSTTFAKMIETHPVRVVEHAVKGMLPHNRQGRAMARRLKVYPEGAHPHQAQIKAEREG